MAGRAAEEIIFEEVSTGAANDLEVATRLVRRMIMEFGMSEKLGPLTFGKKEGQVFMGRDLARERDFSEEVAAAIDKEERDIINQCYQKAKQILNENRDTLVLIAETLLEKETIKADELERLIAGKPIEDAGPQPEKAAQDVESSEEIADEGFSKEVQRPGGVRPVPEVQ